MIIRYAILTPLVVAVLGCQARPAPPPPMPDWPEVPPAPDAIEDEPGPRPGLALDLPRHAVRYDSVAVWLDAPDVVELGTPVPYAIYLVNIVDRPIRLTARGLRQRGRPWFAYDLSVTNERQEVIYRRHYEAPPVLMNARVTLEPRDTFRLHGHWEQQAIEGPAAPHEPVGRGTYFLRAHPDANDRNRWMTTAVRVQIE